MAETSIDVVGLYIEAQPASYLWHFFDEVVQLACSREVPVMTKFDGVAVLVTPGDDVNDLIERWRGDRG